jgi:hypothetical protein
MDRPDDHLPAGTTLTLDQNTGIRPEGLFGARHNDQQVPGFADDAAEQKNRLVWAQWQLDGHCDRNRLHKWKNLEIDHFQSTYTLRLNERSAAK